MLRNALVIVIWGLLLVPASANAQAVGQFSGTPVVELLDQHKIRLVRPFAFTYTNGVKWAVPAGALADGASIPQVFWSLIGGPLDGSYRDASIIHDYYCDEKTRPWREVHRVFYDGMITRGVDPVKAKLMYYAVYKYGPRWESRVERVPGLGFNGLPTMVERRVTVDVPPDAYDSHSVEAAQAKIIATNPSLEEIERIADAAARPPTPAAAHR